MISQSHHASLSTGPEVDYSDEEFGASTIPFQAFAYNISHAVITVTINVQLIFILTKSWSVGGPFRVAETRSWTRSSGRLSRACSAAAATSSMLRWMRLERRLSVLKVKAGACFRAHASRQMLLVSPNSCNRRLCTADCPMCPRTHQFLDFSRYKLQRLLPHDCAVPQEMGTLQALTPLEAEGPSNTLIGVHGIDA